MYYIYGISGPSLLIESTDSMIIIPGAICNANVYILSEHDPGSNRLKVKEVHTCCVDDTSSLSQSSENDEASYTKMEHYGTMVSC